MGAAAQGIGRPASVRAARGVRTLTGIRTLAAATVLLAIVLANALQAHQGGVTGLIQFGRDFTSVVHPPPGATIRSSRGYDGQYFWLMASDPLLLHDAVRGLDDVGDQFRAQRIAYPLVARALGGGSMRAVPYTLILVSFAAMLAGTLALARFAARNGHPEMWGLAIGLAPGLVLAGVRDLADPLAVCAMALGLIAWRRGRRGPAAAWLAVAVLARETMMLAVGAVALEAAIGAGRELPLRDWSRRLVRSLWPAVVVPVVAYAAWRAYVLLRFGGGPLRPTDGGRFGAPLGGAITSLRHSAAEPWGARAWDATYVLAMVVAAAAAMWRVRSRRSASAFAAVAFAVVSLLSMTPDHWSYARYSAPLFVTLVLSALEDRRISPLVLWPTRAAVLLTALIPFALL